jgi:hypothetical protein
MSVAGWFIVLLALVGANVPFLKHRLSAEVNPVRGTGSHAGVVLRRAPDKSPARSRTLGRSE